MPAALNIQPRKRPALEGMLRHDFRQYAPDALPRHIAAERIAHNEVLYGGPNALDALPERQPDTGRKIRKDACMVASMICTLPKELDPGNDTTTRAWAQATLQWLQNECSGQLAYAVLHRDESRPHIHAAVIPADKQGHLSYKVYFSGRQKFRDLQKTYAQALEPLGVVSNSAHVKAMRRQQYTKGINGWRVPQTMEQAIEIAEMRLQAMEPGPPPPIEDASRWETARTMWARMRPQIQRLHQQLEIWQRRAKIAERSLDALKREYNKQLQALRQNLTQQRNKAVEMLLERTPEKEHIDVADKARSQGIKSPQLTSIEYEAYHRRMEKDRGLGL